MEKRFKTKSELLHTKGVGNGLGMSCTQLGEPASKTQLKTYDDNLFTTDPHPYEGKGLKIKVTPEGSEKVQEKAFKLGWYWYPDGKNPKNVARPWLYLNEDRHLEFGTMGDSDGFTELTVQQFLDGDLPQTQYEKDVERLSKYYNNGAYPYGSVLFTKPDAYISNGRVFVLVRDGEAHFDLNSVEMIAHHLHEYNLMSEEEFKAKHSPKPAKVFGEEVKVLDIGLKVGCYAVAKPEAMTFCRLWDTILKEKPNTTIEEITSSVDTVRKLIDIS